MVGLGTDLSPPRSKLSRDRALTYLLPVVSYGWTGHWPISSRSKLWRDRALTYLLPVVSYGGAGQQKRYHVQSVDQIRPQAGADASVVMVTDLPRDHTPG